jgi:hypothetical protein
MGGSCTHSIDGNMSSAGNTADADTATSLATR